MSVTIRILLVDDHQIMRDGLRSLIMTQKDMEVVAEAANGRASLKLARKYKPDIVVMDISMPGLNGIEATRQIRAELPETKVIALSMHSDKQFVDGMLRAGVSAYLLKDCASEELIHSIFVVRSGSTYLSPAITDSLVKEYLQQPGQVETFCKQLSSREQEVLQLVAEGKSTKEIASLLNISIKTVESHRQNIMDKLKIYSVAELTKYAVLQGLTSLES